MDVNNDVPNNEQQNEMPDPTAFLSGLQGNQEPAPTNLPEKIGEFEREKYFGAMNELTEGKVANYEQFQEVLSYKDKFSELREKYSTLEAQSKVSPYASDLSKSVNSMFKDGATIKEVHQFIGMQEMDVAGMPDADAIKLAKKLSLKGNSLSDADLNDWYHNEYENVEEGEELTGSQKINRQEAAQAAKELLGKMKVDSGEPASVRAQRTQRATFESKNNWWGDIMNNSFGKQEKMSFSVPTGKDKDGNEQNFSFDFPVPENIRQEVVRQAANYAASNGMDGTQENYAQMVKFCESMVFAQHGREILAAAVRDSKSKTTEQVNQRHHNVKPFGSQHQNQNRQESIDEDPSLAKKIAESLKSMGPFGNNMKF